MASHALRNYQHNPQDPIIHELSPIKVDGHEVVVRMTVRRTEDGAWRGRMIFIDPESERESQTAEIFCGASEKELWESVGHLREHHLRDLFRSLES